MAATIMHLGAKRIHLWMRSFGHDNQKGTVCYGTPEWCHPNAPWLSQPASAERAGKSKPKASAKPKAKATPKMYEIQVNKNGKRSVNGKTYLKASQVYPPRFALAIVQNQWPHIFKGS